MKKHKAMQLVKALRSGEYVQGKLQLVNDDDEFCGLGVACNLSKAPLEWEYLDDGTWVMAGTSAFLPSLVQKEFGFYTNNGERRDEEWLILNGGKYESLSTANDSGIPFTDIADYIEEHWEML